MRNIDLSSSQHQPCPIDTFDTEHSIEDDDEDSSTTTVNNKATPGVTTATVSLSRDGLTFSTKLFAFCAAMNSVNLGYDIGVSTNAGPKIQTFLGLTDPQLELFLGSINFWSIFGALLSPYLTDQYGRRTTFLFAAIGFILGIVVMITSMHYTQLMIGRMVVGIGVGLGEAIDPMYISEIAPASHRGELVSWAEAGVAMGVVLGFASSLIFLPLNDSPAQWRYMLALGAVMPCVMIALVSLRIMPESPRWLISQAAAASINAANKNDSYSKLAADVQTAQAREILQLTHPPGYNVDQVLADIQASLEIEQKADTAVGWTSILCRPSPSVQRMLLVGVGIAIIQQAVGIDSIMFYMVFVIQRSGITSEFGQLSALLLLGMVKLVFVFVGAKLFDHLGRRPLLFTSLLGMAGSLLVVSVAISFDTDVHVDTGGNNDNGGDNVPKSPNHVTAAVMTVFGLAAYLAFFSTGLGPGNWVVVSEVFATSIRAKAMTIAVVPNRITATLCASSFLSLAHALTWPGFFRLLAVISLLSCWFLYHYLPETKGKSLEEMSHYFAEITGDRSILEVEERIKQQQQQRVVVATSAREDDEDEVGKEEDDNCAMETLAEKQGTMA